MIGGRYCGSLVIVLPFNLCLIPILHVCSLLQQGLRISWQRFTWYKPLTSLTYCKAFSSSPFFFPARSPPFPLFPFALGGRGKHFTLSTWAGSQPSVLVPGVPLWSFWCHKIFIGTGIGCFPMDISSSYRDFTWTGSSCFAWGYRLPVRRSPPHLGMGDLLFPAPLVRGGRGGGEGV